MLEKERGHSSLLENLRLLLFLVNGTTTWMKGRKGLSGSLGVCRWCRNQTEDNNVFKKDSGVLGFIN